MNITLQLILAIVQERDVSSLTKSLSEEGYRTTKLASTGGFLKEGNSTILIGCEDENVPDVLHIIKSLYSDRVETSTSSYPMRASKDFFNMSSIKVGGATVFVLPVEQFHQF